MRDFVRPVRSRTKGELILIRLVRGRTKEELVLDCPVRGRAKGELVLVRPTHGINLVGTSVRYKESSRRDFIHPVQSHVK